MSFIVNKDTVSNKMDANGSKVNTAHNKVIKAQFKEFNIQEAFTKSLIKMQDLMANSDKFTDKYLEDIEYEAKRLSKFAHQFRGAK